MNPYPEIQKAMDYIEINLAGELDLKAVSAAAGFSLSHFHKLFLAATGFTIGSYIRSRRLSAAARELVTTRRRVLDIAVEAGFESQEAFTRAFRSLYGTTPADYRKNRREIIDFDKHASFGKGLEFHYGWTEPRVKIEGSLVDRDEMYLIGKEFYTSVFETIKEDTIPRFWREVFIPVIPLIKNIKNEYVSVGYEVHDPETDVLCHMAAVETTRPEVPAGLELKILPPSRYAVFVPERPLNAVEYGQLLLYAYGEWLPMKGLEQAADYTFDAIYSDRYFSGYCTENSSLKVYIPVK